MAIEINTIQLDQIFDKETSGLVRGRGSRWGST
jgi:hypothetical protein